MDAKIKEVNAAIEEKRAKQSRWRGFVVNFLAGTSARVDTVQMELIGVYFDMVDEISEQISKNVGLSAIHDAAVQDTKNRLKADRLENLQLMKVFGLRRARATFLRS